MLISERPTSMEMVTGISRITSRFGPSRPAMVGALGAMPNSSIGARGARGGLFGGVISASMPLWSMSPDSESAAAHSSASACSSGVTLFWSAMG
ncbi:hypothetical protein D3C76_1491460 [compost metagenome]